MSTRMLRFVLVATCLTVITVHAQDRGTAPVGRGAAPAGRGAARGATPARGVITFSDDQFLHYPLAAADQKYAAIDGRHVKTYVAALTAISRKYRDAGHQYWGRIIGADSDRDNAEWMAATLKSIGAANVRIQPIDLPVQWMPRSWEAVASSAGKSVTLGSMWPSYSTPAIPSPGLDLEAVYVGWGAEADFMGKDVRGKAVFVFVAPEPGSRNHSASRNGALKRAQDKGAAVIFEVIEMPGNIRHSLYPQGTNIPTFSLGRADGEALRGLIETAPAGQAPHVKIRFDVDMVPNLKSADVIGEIPGTTDERIMIVAHRDGFFEAASDNASGVATALGLAEYYAKRPMSERRRTMIIVGTTGHHNNAGGSLGVRWLADNKDVMFAGKTALLINAEHTAHPGIQISGSVVNATNAQGIYGWGTSGSQAFTDMVIRSMDAFGIQRTMANSGGPGAEGSRVAEFAAASTGVIHAAPLFHSDVETDETIPAWSIEATTRAYAKIIDGVNQMTLDQLKGTPISTGGR